MPAAIPIIAGAFLAAGTVATALGVTAVAFTVAGLAVSWAAVATITGVALMGVAMLTMKRPKPGSSGGQLDSKLDVRAPIPVAYGRTATGGYITYQQSWGKKNSLLAIVAVLSAGPVAAIETHKASDSTVYYSGNPTTGLATAQGVGDGSKLYRNKLRQRYQLGEAPASQTVTQASGLPLPGSPGKLSGLAHTISVLEYNTDAFPQGVPKNLWVLRGVKLYDPRKDSTFPGGSGSHRRDNHLTWEYSENPYLAALDWTFGRWWNGKKVYGIGARFEEVDVAAFVNGANVADANNWKIGGVVTTADNKFAVLSTILQSGGGVPTARAAQLSCTVNAPKTATFTLTSADIIGEVEVVNTTTWRDRSNTVVPSYREETQLWAMIAGEQVSSDVYIAEDAGERKTIEVDYPLVQQAAQAHQLATYELCNSREFLTFTVTAKVRALNVRVGDAITVNIPEVAAVSRKCVVISREFNPGDLSVSLTLKSETDDKHPFALGQSQTAPPAPALNGYNPSAPGAPDATAWSATGGEITAPDGSKMPAIIIAGETDDPNASNVIVEYRPAGSSVWLAGGDYAATARTIELTSVTAQTLYDVAIRYRTVRGVVSEPLLLSATAGAQKVNWATVVTGEGKPANNATVGGTVGVDVKNPDGTVFVPIVPGDIDREIAEIKTAIDADIASAKQSASDARTEAEQARSDAAAASAQAAQVRTDLVPAITDAKKAGTDASAEAATVRDILSAEVSRAKGEEGALSTRIVTAQGRADAAHTAIAEETTQRANADTALSNRTNTVEAKLAGTVDSELAARIRAEETARVAADNAIANRTSVVEASYGRVADVIDNGHFDAGLDGWVRFGASIVVPSSYGRSNVVRTVKGARLDSIWGRRYTVKSRDQRFRLSASLRCAEGTSRYYVGAVFFDADGNHVAANDGTGNYPLGSGYDLNAAIHGWLDRNVIIGQGLGYYSDFGGSCGIPDAAQYFRPILFINYLDDPNSVTEVDYFTVEDVTENVATNARLTIEETARSTADTALANRLTTTEAKLSGSQDSELAARIRSEETARVATDNALATRNTTLEAKFNSSSDRKAMTVGPDTFVAVSLGDPATLANGGVYGSTTAYGPHVEFTSAAASLRAVATLGRANHTYKLRARLWQTGGAPTYALWYADYLDGNYNRVGTALIGDWYSIANYFLQTIEREWTSTFIEGAVYIRFSVLVNRLPANPGPETVPGATTRVLEASVENVSSLRATDAVTNARITAEETARTNADSAIANRTSALEAQMNDQSDSWLRARIREEATARADGDNAIANRASVLESQMSGTQPSGLQTLVKDNRKNLADVGWWKKGASIPWGLNGGQQNEIISFPDGTDWGGGKVSGPDGQSADVWYCRADAGGDSAGGWNNVTIAPLDPDKTYRFIVPIVQLGSAGARTAYWGTGGVCDLNTSNPNGNPYFGFHGNMTPNRWRLFVGYIFPRNSTGRTHDGAGVFDMLTGELVSQGWNYCFRPDGAQPIHRAYQYYSYSGSYQAFGRPLVELVDGSETPFPSLSPALRTANARITLEETTRANADSALASRASALEAQMNDTSDSWLRARIREEATARANADSALANRASSLETNFSRIPETWRVRAHGNGAQRPAGFGEVGVFAPNGSSQGGYSRSYTVVWFQDGANIVDGVRAFDTYGDGQIKYNGGGAGDNDSGAMARCLNAIPQGRTVIVYSADEPSINRRGNGLTEAMRRCGAGPVFESDQFKLHSAYILIGKAGAGQGNGTEYYAGSYDTDLMAWLDITFTLTNGRATIGNQAGVAVTAAKIAAEETTRANADNAIANRVATTEAQFRREIASPLNTTVDSLVNANDYRYREIIQANTRITNEETTRANADSALGNRISTVEASYVTQSQLRVADMDLHFDANIPANDAWAPSVYGTGTLDGRITKTVAWNSISCLYWGVQGGAEVYSRKTIPVDPSRKYRMKARFGAYNTGSTGNGDRFYIGFVGIDAYGNILDHSPNGTYRYAVCPGEVIVDGNIVERSVVVTGEGNDSLLKFPPGTRQIRLLVFMNYDGRAVSSYVDYFTIEEITEVDARVSEEATARANADSALASRTNLLEGQISGANDSYVLARLRNEETARANADSALVSRTNALEAQMNDQSDSWLRARIREEASARADADSALSTRSTNLETRAGNVESRVTTTEGAISNLNGRSAAYWQVEAVAGGRARLRAYADNYGSAIDIAADQVYLGNKRTLAIENDRATITGDLYAGNGRIIMDNGTVMKVAGTGFGSANQFIEWFGPRQTNLANCTEANATYYLKTNGSAYFGGALSAGVIKNSVQTTALIGTANVTTGTFGSNGGSRVITVGYTGTGQESVSGACPAYYTPYVRIRLYRGTDANGALLAEQQINGSYECEPATRSGATTEPGFLTDQIGGSFTYTDNGGGTSVGYFVQIVARELRGALSQSLSLTSVEG